MSWYCGVDPGVTGAIAFYDGELLRVFDFPTEIKMVGKKKRNKINITETVNIFRDHIGGYSAPRLTFLEEVHSLPNDGAISAFAFGESFGIIRAILDGLALKTLLIQPGVWKSQLGLSSNKEASILKARLTFTESSEYFKNKKDHGRAEASLLAKSAFDKFGGAKL